MRQALAFAVIAGLFAEATELLRLHGGGIAAVPWDIRVTLFVAYAIVGAVLYAVAVVLARGRRRPLAIAAALFAAFTFVPWINFDYLPTFWGLRSLLSNVVLVACALGVGFLAARFARATVVMVVVVAIAANVMWRASHERPDQVVSTPASSPPAINVALLLLDTTRADHLGAYGYGRPTSPEFDRLAQDGVLFERASAQAAWTKPSVTSLLTSAYVHRHGVIGSRDALNPDLPVLAEQMRARGFRTAAFSANPWITAEFGFDRGFEHFESANAMGIQLTNIYRLLGRAQRLLNAAGAQNQLRKLLLVGPVESNASNSERDQILTDAALAWLRDHADGPFFLYVHLMGPHDPYDPPADYAQPFRETSGTKGPPLTRPPARVQSIFETAAPLGREALAELVSQYDGAVRFTDAQVGRIVAELKRLGLFERTLLIIVGDHGEEFHEHGNWRHGNQMYDEVVHVPMLFRLPGVLPPARRADAAMLIDVFPSILGIVGRPAIDVTLDGQNLFAPRAGAAAPVFAEQWRFEGGQYVSRMVGYGDLKFIETRDESLGQRRAELYNLGTDPGEQRDLLRDGGSGGPEETGELQALLTRFGSSAPTASRQVVEPSRATEERLRALGYVD